MTEKQVETQIIEYIKSIGGYCVKVHSGQVRVLKTYGHRTIGMYDKTGVNYMQLAPKGTPDLFACIKDINGMAISLFLEVKKDNYEVSRWNRIIDRYKKGSIKKSNHREYAQYEQMQKIIKAGGKCAVVGNIEDVKSVLKEYDIITCAKEK